MFVEFLNLRLIPIPIPTQTLPLIVVASFNCFMSKCSAPSLFASPCGIISRSLFHPLAHFYSSINCFNKGFSSLYYYQFCFDVVILRIASFNICQFFSSVCCLLSSSFCDCRSGIRLSALFIIHMFPFSINFISLFVALCHFFLLIPFSAHFARTTSICHSLVVVLPSD